MPVYTQRPRCSTKAPKVRRRTGATRKAGIRERARVEVIELVPFSSTGGGRCRRIGGTAVREEGPTPICNVGQDPIMSVQCRQAAGRSASDEESPSRR